MTRIRLIPLVLIAISSLFVLKATGLLLNNSFLSGGVAPALAQTSTENANPASALAQATDDADGNTEQANAEENPLPPHPDDVGITIVPGQEDPNGARTAVLERLRERRLKLDAFEQELTMRENLLGAAEMRLDSRIKELKEIEARISAAIGEVEAEQKAQLDGLVTMYETMKPKDAARIFNRLDMSVLIDVVSQMKARKMAVILAAMDSEAAERLTIEIARRGQENPFQNDQATDESDLPKIGENSSS